MSDNQASRDEQASPPVAGLPEASPDLRRRRLAAAGLAASGVLLTVTSRSVFAASGAASAAASAAAKPHALNGGNGTDSPTQLGERPEYWVALAKTGSWQFDENLPCNTRFGALFNQCTAGNELTILEALEGGKSSPESRLAQLVAAAHLNVLSGKSPGYLTLADVQKMASGSYVPAIGGATWNQEKIVSFLELTMRQDA